MEQLGVVDEADECRRPCGGLSHVVYLEPPALIGRGLHPRRCVGEHIVQLARRDTHGVLSIDEFNKLKQTVEPYFFLRRDKDYRSVGHERKILHQLLALLIHGLAVLLDGIPLVDRNYAALAHLVSDARDL